MFINDLEINLEGRPALFKYADDSTIIVPFWGNGQCRTDLVDQFLSCSRHNCMKRKFMSKNVNIRDLLEKADKTLYKKDRITANARSSSFYLRKRT